MSSFCIIVFKKKEWAQIPKSQLLACLQVIYNYNLWLPEEGTAVEWVCVHTGLCKEGRGALRTLNFSLSSCRGSQSLRTETLSLSKGLFYCYPIYIFSKFISIAQNILPKPLKVTMPIVNSRSRNTTVCWDFPNQVVHRLCTFGKLLDMVCVFQTEGANDKGQIKANIPESKQLRFCRPSPYKKFRWRSIGMEPVGILKRRIKGVGWGKIAVWFWVTWPLNQTIIKNT